MQADTGAAQPGGANANAIRFAHTPATATDDIIDYSTKEGKSIWKAATEPLSSELFDCTPDGLRYFLKRLQQRSWECGWENSILSIPTDPLDPLGETVEFIANYGTISMEQLRANARQYVTTQTRVAQDSTQLYTCLMNSLSTVGWSKVTLQEEEYTINSMKVGILLLKVIIRVSAIDTNATVMSIRSQLGNIDTYIATVNYDITKTNERVNTLLEALSTRGETTHDMLSNLFRAYRTVKDKQFLRYIEQKESDYEEGILELTPTKLMLLAENKFKTLKEKSQWQAPSEEEEKIIALEAEVKALRNKAYKPKNDSKGGNKRYNNKDSDNRKSKFKSTGDDGKHKWKTIPPKEGEPKTKIVDDTKWHFCEKHKRWTLHSTEQCKGHGIKKGEHGDKAKTKSPNPKLVRAQEATIHFAERDEDSDSE